MASTVKIPLAANRTRVSRSTPPADPDEAREQVRRPAPPAPVDHGPPHVRSYGAHSLPPGSDVPTRPPGHRDYGAHTLAADRVNPALRARRERARRELYGLIARTHAAQPHASRPDVIAFLRVRLGPGVIDPLLTPADRQSVGLPPSSFSGG